MKQMTMIVVAVLAVMSCRAEESRSVRMEVHSTAAVARACSPSADWRVTPQEAKAIAGWMIETAQRPVDSNEVAVADPPRDMKLFLLIGQSNMAGRGTVSAEDRKAPPRCLKLNRDGVWVQATSPIHFDRRTSGYGIADTFVRRYLEEHPNDTVGLIPCAVGGSLSATWSPEDAASDPIGANYRFALKRARRAQKNGQVVGILWHQGEADRKFVRERAGRDRYVARLAALAAALRRELGCPGVPFLIGEIGTLPVDCTVMNPVLAAAAEAIPNGQLVKASDLTGHLPDGVHFDTPSYKILGARYYEAWKRMACAGQNGAAARPPRAGEGLVVDGNVPAGNVVVEKIEGDTVRLSREMRGSKGDWFYWAFRVKGAKGRTLRFVFDPKICWGGPVGVRGPAVTTDRGRTWCYPCDGKSTKNAFSYTFASDDEVRFYETWQYLPSEWEAFLAGHAAERGKKFVTGVLCKSPKGRDVPNARFGCLGGNPRYRIFMSSRHHCSESTATPVLEGVAAAFLADDDLGRWLCANVELMIVPFVDYDGALEGDQGKNRAPHDHNRDYTEFIYPETRAIRDWIMEHANGRLDFFIDVHCPWIRDSTRDRAKMSNEFLYTPWKDPKIVPNAALERRYSELLEKLQCGSMRYRAADDLPFGRLWNKGVNYKEGWSAVIWACRTLKGLRIARTYEVPFAMANGAVVTPQSCRELGHDTAKVFRALLTSVADDGI